MIDVASLVQKLRDQPTAPTEGFDRFLVGVAQGHRLALVQQLHSIVEGAPSSLRVILGPNGNGKTLLNNALQLEASNINLRTKNEKHTHSVLFARVSVETLGPASAVGLQIAQNLRRSIWEPPKSTYSSIAATLVDRFATQYQLPLPWKVATMLPRYALNRLLREYKEAVGKLASEEKLPEDVPDLVEKSIKASDEVIRYAIASWRMRRALRLYLREYQLGGFFDKYISKARETNFSQAEINRDILQALGREGGNVGLLQSLQAIAEISADIDCKCLLILVDDCNTSAAQRLCGSEAVAGTRGRPRRVRTPTNLLGGVRSFRTVGKGPHRDRRRPLASPEASRVR